MNQLTNSEKKQLMTFIEQNQDSGWTYIARWATQQFQKVVTDQEVAKFYITALCG